SIFNRLTTSFLLVLFRLRLWRFHRFRAALDQFHVGNMNWTFAFGDFAARIILRLAEVLLDNANAFNQDTLLSRKHRQDPAGRTAEIPRDDLDLIAFFNVTFDSIHRTSGASETI